MEQKQTLRETIDRYSNVARFAKCLDISRPSMYKYIENYDKGDVTNIPDHVKTVFNTLMTGNDDFKMIYCNELYATYLKTVDSPAETVPKDIAAKIDNLELTTDDVDEWITHTQGMKDELESEIEGRNLDREIYKERLLSLDKRLKDLEYTRELVGLRMEERHFIAVKEGKMEWIVSTGPTPFDLYPYEKEEIESDPELKKGFKCCKAKNEDGYMFYFAGASEDDIINVNVVTNALWNEGISTRIATFTPDKGQFFVKIPRIFDDAHEYAFNYEVERMRAGAVLNRIEGFFQR